MINNMIIYIYNKQNNNLRDMEDNIQLLKLQKLETKTRIVRRYLS